MGIRKIKKYCDIPQDDFEWYISTHHTGDDTNKTGFSALMAMLFHSYREICEERKGDMKSLTLGAARIVKEEIEG